MLPSPAYSISPHNPDISVMVSTNASSMALPLLHYISPFATALCWLSASTLATCLLHKPSKRPVSKLRRWSTITLQLVVSLGFLFEGLITIVQTNRQPKWWAPQDYGVYLITTTTLHFCLTLCLLEKGVPILYPYLGAWLVAFGFEISIFTLQATAITPNDNIFAKSRFAFQVERIAVLLALVLITAVVMLKDRQKSVRLDDESEALLASQTEEPNGHPPKPIHGSDSGVDLQSEVAAQRRDNKDDDDEDDEDDDMGFDSDAEDPEEAKEMRAKQRKRLKESGSWFAYLKEFGIFLPMLIPRKDRLAQGCLIVIVIVTLAERAVNILAPRQIGIIVNRLTDTAGTGEIPWGDIVLYVIYMYLQSYAGLPVLRSMCQLPVDAYGRKAIVTTAFRHVMSLSMDFHNSKDSGELIRAIEQGTGLQDLVLMALFDVVPIILDLLVACVYISVLFDAYVALIPLGVGIAYIWIGVKTTGWAVSLRRDLVATERFGSKIQNEAITNWQTVSHFNRAGYESTRYNDATYRYNLAERWYYLVYYLSMALQTLSMLTGHMVAILLAIYRVSQGYAPIGSLVTLLQYWAAIEWPLDNLSYNVRRVTTMLTDSERLLQLLNTQPTVADTPDAKELVVTKGEVVFDHCAFAYDPRKPIIKDVSFTAKPGQTVALVGETGGGKSTIMKLLFRYYDLTSGSIRVDGQDIRNVTLDSLRDIFGMVPQDPSLFNAPIIENLKYARLDATDEEVYEACRAAAIHDKIETFPDKYQSKVGERGVKLSGGEMQRVSIARAILRRPKIVLLDEATSMIDAETEASIQHAFKQLSHDRTTFVIAHRLSTIQHADLILVIQDGEILEQGTHDELFTRKGKYYKLWSKQFSKDVMEVGKALNASQEEPPLIQVDGSDDEESDDDGDH